MKSAFNWRLGTTSYIIPDHILPNLEYLKDKVDDVELVLFESPVKSGIPDPAEVKRMKSLAADWDLSYTVHLPLDVHPGDEDEKTRQRCVEMWLRVMELMHPLDPLGWVVHLNHPPSPDDSKWPFWKEQCLKSLDALARETDRSSLCIENLDYDHRWIWPWILETGFSLCMDIGHLLVRNEDTPACCAQWLKHAQIIHLHAVDGKGRDHAGLQHMQPQTLSALLRQFDRIDNPSLVVTLEVFSLKDLEGSLEALGEART